MFVDSIKYVKGDRVSANLERWLDDEAYKGEIVAVNEPDPTVKKGVKKVTYTIDFKDGNLEEGVKGSEIVYSDSKTYKRRKLATRWYVKCMYKHHIHDKGKWGKNILINPKTHAATLRDITSKLRVEYIASLIQYKKPDPKKEGFHALIQKKEPDRWMNVFFNTEKIYSDDITNNFAKSEIKSVRLSHMKKIGDDAFNNCPIEGLYLPMVEEIGDRAFENCPIEGTHSDGFTLTPILDLPNVKQIGASAFKIPTNSPYYKNSIFPFITKLSLPKVKWIYDDALNRAKLEKLELPEVREIGKNFLNEGFVDFIPGTKVYDIHWPKIRKLGRGFLSGMQGGVVPLPYEFLLENPDAYLKGIGGKPVQWVDKFRNEVVCIQLKWVFPSESSLNLHWKVLNRYHQPISIVKAIKKTILDYLSKGHKVSTDSRDHEISTRSDKLPYFIQNLNISVKGKIDPETFRKKICSLLGRDGACKVESNLLGIYSNENLWTAVMVYKGSGGSSSWDNNTVTGMMMSLKF